MSFTVFNTRTDIKGGALIAKLSRDNSLFLSLFKQVANNPDKKGNFDFSNSIGLKLNEDEIGEIIRAVRDDGEMRFYHTFQGEVTTGNFRHYVIPPQGDKPAKQGFGFSIKKGEDEVKVGFTVGAAERFRVFLEFVLNKINEAEFIEDLAKEQEYQEKKKSSAKSTAKTPVKSPPVKDVPEKQLEDIPF